MLYFILVQAPEITPDWLEYGTLGLLALVILVVLAGCMGIIWFLVREFIRAANEARAANKENTKALATLVESANQGRLEQVRVLTQLSDRIENGHGKSHTDHQRLEQGQQTIQTKLMEIQLGRQ